MSQLDAITGGVMRRRPALARRAELEAQAPYIPTMIKQEDDKEYNDEVLDETKRQNRQVNAMNLADYNAARDAEDTANKFKLAELGIAGFGALNEATDGNLMDWGQKALSSVLPGDSATSQAADAATDAVSDGYNTWSQGASYPDAGGQDDSIISNILGGIGNVASAVTPDPIENVVKKAFDIDTWTGEDGIWSDVTGFVDDIIDFDFDLSF